MKRLLQLFVVALGVSLVAGAAGAHEFILKPVSLAVDKEVETPLSVVSAHVFMISEEMEPLDKVDAKLIQGDEETSIALTENEVLMTLDGRFKAEKKGTAILAGHRKGMIWTKTTKGWKQQSKKGLQGVVSSGNYEKFCKTLVTVEEPDGNFAKEVGHTLEIMPLDDPAQIAVGDDIEVQVLYKGKPISVESVTATYDGFTSTPNTYAYFTEPYGDGKAKVKISHPGVWMIRVQHAVEQKTADYDKLVMRAVLAFEVD